jgi:alpha/beta superfamily hydrolase
MTPRTVIESIAGPAGTIECAVDNTEGPARGVAVICHPHPQFGGTMTNKVVQTLARALVQLGWRSVRFNFRGIGASQGAWDEGRGEVDDALAVLAAYRRTPAAQAQPFLLAGFSFGGFVAAEAAHRLPADAKPQRLVLIGPSTEKQQVPPVPADVVPLAATLDWARPQALPVIVFPGVGHFFHGQLGLLKTVVIRQMQAGF